MNKPRKRHWVLTSHGAGAGKTTFLASNARPPIMVIDADGRFDASEPLVDGSVHYATQVIDTLALAEELIVEVPKNGDKSMLWDSMTKIYSLPARLGFMRNKTGRRSSSRAAEMVDKSNAMTLARDLVVLGTDVYYCWHTTEGVDGMGKTEVRDMISDVEKNRLMTSVNVQLEFAIEQGGIFSARVVYARDFGDRKANVGFKIYDKPGNYWRGGADLLEQMIYTPYTSKEEALKWTADKLGLNIDEAEGVYDHAKELINPENSGQMFAMYYLHVKGLYEKEPGAPPGTPEIPEEEPIEEPVEELESGPFDNEDNNEPVEEPAETPEPETNGANESRESLIALGEKITVGNVVFSVATAWPEKFTADQALLKLRDYPDVPEGTELRMDRSILDQTGLKMFDWLGSVDIDSD